MKRGAPGQALVEFALVLPLMVALMLGIVDVGRAVVVSASLSNASREAARYGALHRREADWLTQAETRGRDTAVGLDLSLLTLTISTETAGADTFVRVTGSYSFQPAAPLMGALTGNITLTANSRMLSK